MKKNNRSCKKHRSWLKGGMIQRRWMKKHLHRKSRREVADPKSFDLTPNCQPNLAWELY